jgi:hypothetical protein
MLKIAEMRGDVMGRFHNALYLGDVREQVGCCTICTDVLNIDVRASCLGWFLPGP